jgi:hypothetical protein
MNTKTHTTPSNVAMLEREKNGALTAQWRNEKAEARAGQNTRIERNLGDAVIEEETLSDGSKVYNVHIPKQTIYCRNQITSINLISELSDAISKAQS